MVDVPAALASPRDQLRRSVFTPQVGRTFTFVSATSFFRARLSEVGDLPSQQSGAERRFRLLFHTPGTATPGGTYTVRGPRTRLPMFVSPVGDTPGWYEAVVIS